MSLLMLLDDGMTVPPAPSSGVPIERNRHWRVQVYPSLLLYDGGQEEVEGENDQFGTTYELTATVRGIVTAPSAAELGPALNALYARVVNAALADERLGGLCQQIDEGELVVGISTETGAAPTAEFDLDLVVTYCHRHTDTTDKRETVLAALAAQLAQDTDVGLPIRELVLASYAAHLAETLPIERNRDGRAVAGVTLALRDGNTTDADFPDQGIDTEVTYGRVYVMRPTVEITVNARKGAEAETAADLGPVANAYRQAVRAAIRSAGSLGGLCLIDAEEGETPDPEFNHAGGSGPSMTIRIPAVLTYATDDNDVTTQPAWAQAA